MQPVSTVPLPLNAVGIRRLALALLLVVTAVFPAAADAAVRWTGPFTVGRDADSGGPVIQNAAGRQLVAYTTQSGAVMVAAIGGKPVKAAAVKGAPQSMGLSVADSGAAAVLVSTNDGNQLALGGLDRPWSSVAVDGVPGLDSVSVAVTEAGRVAALLEGGGNTVIVSVFSADGTKLNSARLPYSARTVIRQMLVAPDENGGFLAGFADQIVQLDATGNVVETWTIPNPPMWMMAADRHGTFAAMMQSKGPESGDVGLQVVVRAPGQAPRTLQIHDKIGAHDTGINTSDGYPYAMDAANGRALVTFDYLKWFNGRVTTFTADGVIGEMTVPGKPELARLIDGEPLIIFENERSEMFSQRPGEQPKPLADANGTVGWPVLTGPSAGGQATIAFQRNGRIMYSQLRDAPDPNVRITGGTIGRAAIERSPAAVHGVGFPPHARLRGLCQHAGNGECVINKITVKGRYRGRTVTFGSSSGNKISGRPGIINVDLDFNKAPANERIISQVLQLDRWLRQRKTLPVTVSYRFTDPTGGTRGTGRQRVRLRVSHRAPRCRSGCRS